MAESITTTRKKLVTAFTQWVQDARDNPEDFKEISESSDTAGEYAEEVVDELLRLLAG